MSPRNDGEQMHNPTKAFLSLPSILLVGICSCDSDAPDLPIGELEVIDEDGPTAQPGLGEIDSTEPETVEIINDPFEADFNGDGYADLAIGVPNDDESGVRSGAVNVIYGSEDGLRTGGPDTPPDQIWHLNNIFGPGVAVAGDDFGWALAAGDFDNDGVSDLAIGAPGFDPGVSNAGLIVVLFGTQDVGLTATGAQLVLQSFLVADGSEAGDNFGKSLAAGDFNDEDADDLAVGVPGEDIGTLPAGVDAGAVNIIYSLTGVGLAASGPFLHQGPGGGLLGEAAEFEDGLGTALAAGDFDENGNDDLAIGVPGEDLAGPVVEDAGLVHVVYGAAAGLDTANQEIWTQGPLDDDPEEDDQFGSALATGDFDNNGADDLAIGVPFEEVSGNDAAGAVNVIYGADTPGVGLAATDDQFWHEDQPGVDGSTDSDDLCGAALSAGNYDGDSRDDLAIGCPSENLDEDTDAGAVGVLYGTSAAGLSSSGDQRWNQDSDGILDSAEDDDMFGSALTSGDFDADGETDLAIGVPFEGLQGGITAAGAVNVLYGDDDGLDDDDDQLWHQNRSDAFGPVEGVAKANEHFGAALPDSPALDI
jgi:hypothetical protein